MLFKKNSSADFTVSPNPERKAPMTRPPKAVVGLGVAGLLAAGLPGLAMADDAAAAAAPKATYDFQGYVDASYSHLSEGGVFTSGVPNRVFDTQPDAFTLQQAALFANINAKDKYGAYINLTAGSDAGVIKSYGSTTDQFDVTQAYFRFQSGHTTFIAGKFVTLAGAEVIDSRSMPVYSRSILFGYAVPFTHTGLRATFAPSDKFGITIGANNGWDQMKDTNTDKTYEFGISVTPSMAFSLYLNYYDGKEGPIDASADRSLLDLVINWNITDKFGLGFNYDDGTQKGSTAIGALVPKDAKWNGWAAYLKYKFSDTWNFLLRTEDFDDKDGFRTGVVQKWKETTVALAFSPSMTTEIRFEVRDDTSDVHSFVSKNGLAVNDGQNSYAVEFLYKY
jgi:hypothetical protein